MSIEYRDCVVIGGGPAGSTFSAIARKYDPSLSITVLEKERFPRYHIGESTIPAGNGVLRDLEVYEDLERSTFIKKMGIVFVWGENRQPWSADYLRLREVKLPDSGADIIDVTGQDFRGVIDRLGYLDTPVTAFNVRRAEFDKMLLDKSRDFGADVREGARATAILRDATGSIEGVKWEDDIGRSGTIMTPFVLDASGLMTFMTKGEREFDPNMNNFAVYGYLSNAEWKVTFNGKRDRSTVFIAAVDEGWIWYFPIGPDIMSVGAVTRTENFRRSVKDGDLESFWRRMLDSCPEVRELVKNAKVRTDILPDGKRVAASQDWSSWARSPIGDGWAAAGDAAIFVDPILSSGVTLAMQSGHRAAYTFNTTRARKDLPERSLWQAYADYIRGEYGAFLTMARHFYGNNKAARSWWWESQRVVNRAGRLELDDHQSFTMATAGFFPVPRTNTSDVVGSLLKHLSGTKADLLNIQRETGVPEFDALARCDYSVLAPFRLDLRTEPVMTNGPQGVLDVYYDLVTDSQNLAHRLAAAPCRINPMMSPVVDAIGRHYRAPELLNEAPRLLPPSYGIDHVRHSTLEILRAAAMKGFVQIKAEDLCLK
ncbi:MAG: tryptophan 7-halogenase [Acidobacteria bacterium]|nr:tryptophan 7-halogenase [Acidobacteriota bacterium]